MTHFGGCGGSDSGSRQLAEPLRALDDRARRLRGRRGVDRLRAHERRDRRRAGRAARDRRTAGHGRRSRTSSAGLLAWWRRPASRFGPLMSPPGFVCFLVTLSWTTHDVSVHDRPGARHAAGGRLPARLPRVPERPADGRFERVLVAAAYAIGDRAELVRMVARRLRPAQPARLRAAPGGVRRRASTFSSWSLSASAAWSASASSSTRRRRAGRPLRRSVALLIDSFALGLVMIAVLLRRGRLRLPRRSSDPARDAVRELGLAPFAFLVGLLDARLARSAVGDLFVELRADPSPADLRDALARALRDPSLTLAYWLPEFETWADLDGRRGRAAASPSGRGDDADRPRRRAIAALAPRPGARRRARAARRGRRGGRDRARERPPAGRAAGAARGAEGLARAGDRGGPEGAAAAGAQPARRRAAAADRALARARACSRSSWPATRGARRGSIEARQRDRRLARRAARRRARPPSRRCSAGTGSPSRSSRSPRSAPVPVRLERRASTAGCPSRSRSPPTTSSPRASPTSASTRRRPAASVDVSRAGGVVVVEVVDDGVGGADTRARLGPARPRRPGRGARRPAARLEPRAAAARACARRSRAGSDRRGQRPAARGARAAARRGRLRRRRRSATTPTTCCSRCAATRRTSRSSTSGCRRRTTTRGCARRSRSARSTRRSACSCSRSTSSSGWR